MCFKLQFTIEICIVDYVNFVYNKPYTVQEQTDSNPKCSLNPRKTSIIWQQEKASTSEQISGSAESRRVKQVTLNSLLFRLLIYLLFPIGHGRNMNSRAHLLYLRRIMVERELLDIPVQNLSCAGIQNY